MKLKFIIIALPVLLVITGCSTEEKVVRPTAVLDSAPDVPYGKPGESQRVLRKAGEMVRSAYTELNTLDISSDYLNVRDPEITFSETWSSAWGVGTLFLIAVDSESDRIIFTTKDNNAVCWILQIKVSKNKESNIRRSPLRGNGHLCAVATGPASSAGAGSRRTRGNSE